MLSDNHRVWLGAVRYLPTSGARHDGALKMEGCYGRSSVERSRARRRDDGVVSVSSHITSRRDRPRSTPSVNGSYDSCARRNDRRTGSARQIRTLSDSCSEVGSSDSGSRERRSRGALLRVHRAFSSPAGTMETEELARLRFVQDLQEWVSVQQAQVDHAGWGQDMREVDLHLQQQTAQHAAIASFKSKLEEAKQYENDISQYYKMRYGEHLGMLNQHYQILLVSSERRLQNLECLRLLVTRATEQLLLLNEQEETELAFDWSDRNPNMSAKRDAHAVLMKDLEKMELTLNQIHKHGEHWIQQGHPAGKTIEALLAVLQVQWGWVLQLCLCVGKHLLENTAYFQFFRDALDTKEQLVELHTLMQKQRASSLGDYRDLKRTSKVILERLEEVEVAVGNLSRKSTQIVQLKPRRPDHAVTAPLPIKAICDYKQDGVLVCQKDQAYFLQDSTHRVCWRVFLPGGTQATVPSVCYIILPPNREAIAASERLQEMLNDVRRLWRQVHADTEAALLWHTLREEVTAVHTWTLAAFKRMKEEEHLGVMSSLEEHYEEFKSTQSTCEILGEENYAHMEANVWATRQHYKNLLKAIGQAYTPPPLRLKSKPFLVGVERRGGGAVSPRLLPHDASEDGTPSSGSSPCAESLTANDGDRDATTGDIADNSPPKSVASALEEDLAAPFNGEFDQDQARAAVAEQTSSQRSVDPSGPPAEKLEHNPRHLVREQTTAEERQAKTTTRGLQSSSSNSSSTVVTKSAAMSQEESYKNAEITAQIEKLKAEMARLFGDKASMEQEMNQLRGVAAESQRLKERAEAEAARQRTLAETAVREKRGAEEKVLSLARAESEAAALYRSATGEVERLRLKAEEALRLRQQAEKEAQRLSRLREEAMEIRQVSWERQDEGLTGGGASAHDARAARVRMENVRSLVSQVEEAKAEADRQTARYQRQLDEVHRLKALAEQEAAARAWAQEEAESLRREAETAARQRGRAESRALELQERAERETERQLGILGETAAQKERAEGELAGLRATLREMHGQKTQLAGEKEALRAEIRGVTVEKERVEAELRTLRAQMLEMRRGGGAGASQHQETQYEITQWESAIAAQDVEDEHELADKDAESESAALGHDSNSESMPQEDNADTESFQTQDDIRTTVNHNIADDNLEEADENSGTSHLVIERQSHEFHRDDVPQPTQDSISVKAFEECASEPNVEMSGSNQTADESAMDNNSEENDATSTSDGAISRATVHEEMDKPGSEGDVSLTLVVEDIVTKQSLEEDILASSEDENVSMPELNDNASCSNVVVSVEDISQRDLEEDDSEAVEVNLTVAASENVNEISMEDATQAATFEEVISTSTGNTSILKPSQSLEENFADQEDSNDDSPVDDSDATSITDQNITNTQVDEVVSHPAENEILSKSNLTAEENISEVSVTVEENVTNVLLEERVSKQTQEEVTSMSNQDTDENSATPTIESYTGRSALNSTDLESSLEDITSTSSWEDTSNRVLKGRSIHTVRGNTSTTSPEDEISNPFLEENISSQSLKQNISKPTEDSETPVSLTSAATSSEDETVIPDSAIEGVNVSYVRAVNGCEMLANEIPVDRVSEMKLDVDRNENGFGDEVDTVELDSIVSDTNDRQHPSRENDDIEVLVDSVETERYFLSRSRPQGGEFQPIAHNDRETNAFEMTTDANGARISADADFATGFGQAPPERRVTVTENRSFLEETDPGQGAEYSARPQAYARSGQSELDDAATDPSFLGLAYGDGSGARYDGGPTGFARQVQPQEPPPAADFGRGRAPVFEHDWARSSSEASEETRDAEAALADDSRLPLPRSGYRLPAVSTATEARRLRPATESRPGPVVLFENAKMAARELYGGQLPSERTSHAAVGVFDKNYRAEKMSDAGAAGDVHDRSLRAERPSNGTAAYQSKKKTSVFQGDSSLDDKIKCMKSELEILLHTVSETSSARLQIPRANERVYRDEYEPCWPSSVTPGRSPTFTPGVGLDSATGFGAGYDPRPSRTASLEGHSSGYCDSEFGGARDSHSAPFSATYGGTFERTSLERKPQEVTLQGLRAPVTLNELISSKVIDQKTATQITSGAVTIQEASRRLAPYLQGNKVIGGLYIESVRERISIYNAIRRRIIRPGSGLQLLEAQAATGFVIEPETRRKLSVDEAMRHGVIGGEFYEKLLSAEQAVTGYRDLITGERLSLFQAMRRGLIVRVHGLRLLEAQAATGGIIDPTFSHRLPLEVACARGLIDGDITRTLADLSDDNKGFFDPNTDENLTYTQLQQRCVPDPGGDHLLLPLVPNPHGGRMEPAELQLALGKVKIYRDMSSLYRKIVSSAP